MIKHTHSDRLERWLGKDQVESIVKSYGNFYHPIAVHGVPGNVHIMPGGDFIGEIKAGAFLNKEDSAAQTLKKLLQVAKRKASHTNALGTLIEMLRAEDRSSLSIGAFSSIDAVVAAFTGGKGQSINFNKTGVASNAIGNSNDLWSRSGFPVAGAAGAAAPGGTVWSSASAGALPYINGASANSNHYLNWALSSSVINNSLMLYDRLFSVAAGAALTGPTSTAISGAQTRYTSSVTTAVNYAGGNFAFPSNPTTVLAATAHNWAVGNTGPVGMVYTNQAGTTGKFAQVVAGVSACVVGGIDLAVGSWFLPLAAGDSGILQLTNMQASAAVATGTIDWVLAHPIAINACPIANLACLDDGLYTSLNLTPIMDGACLSWLELTKPATTATNYSGLLRYVSE